jgi:predicted PurR-regulated permease PerM
MSHRQFIERLVIAIGVIAFAVLLWRLKGLIILVFGAVLVAVILNIIARPICRRLSLPNGVALALAVMFVAALFGAAFWMFGAEVAEQAEVLREMVPAAWTAFEARLEAWGLGEPVRAWTDELGQGGGVISNIGGLALTLGAGITDAILILVGGIYLAARPELYRTGLIKLVPPGGRALAREALEDSGRALRLWLLGQMAAMVMVGALTGLGLWLLGVPSPLMLGLVAGLLEFIPFAGPFLAAIPGVLLALAIGPELALWTALLYLLIQQLEGNVITPLVQQKAVEIPPALLLFALVASGMMFGVIGILFAAPLTVVLFVMVKRLYVREALHTPTPLPGEEAEGGRTGITSEGSGETSRGRS